MGSARMLFNREKNWETQVVELLTAQGGLTDQQISEKIQLSAQMVAIVCRQLEYKGKLIRKRRTGTPIQNHLALQE